MQSLIGVMFPDFLTFTAIEIIAKTYDKVKESCYKNITFPCFFSALIYNDVRVKGAICRNQVRKAVRIWIVCLERESVSCAK